jgi:hypothetical protein
LLTFRRQRRLGRTHPQKDGQASPLSSFYRALGLLLPKVISSKIFPLDDPRHEARHTATPRARWPHHSVINRETITPLKHHCELTVLTAECSSFCVAVLEIRNDEARPVSLHKFLNWPRIRAEVRHRHDIHAEAESNLFGGKDATIFRVDFCGVERLRIQCFPG